MVRFAIVSCSIVWLLVFSTGILHGAEASREQPITIRIAYVSPVTTMAPIWIAAEIGPGAASPRCRVGPNYVAVLAYVSSQRSRLSSL
jgi:hypothetical protein